MSDHTLDEGTDFAACFTGVFGDAAGLKVRQKLDKRSGQSQTLRARKSVRSHQFNMRCTPEFKTTAAAMANERGISIADLLEILVFAEAKGRKA